MTIRRWLFLFLGACLVIDIYYAATLPVTSEEGAVYSRYIARPLLDTWSTPLDSQIGIPYVLLARIVKWAAGVSELALRLPAVLGGLLFGLFLIRTVSSWSKAALVLLFLVSDPFRVFNSASGTGLSLGLAAAALIVIGSNLWLAGLLLGLTVASAPIWFSLAIVLVMAVDYAKRKDFWFLVDQFLLPVFLTAALFLSPIVLSSEKLQPAARGDKSTRALIQKIPVGKAVTVSVSNAIEPGVNFYRRRFHLNWMSPIRQDGPDLKADYYLLLEKDNGLIQKRGLKTLAVVDGIILARANVI